VRATRAVYVERMKFAAGSHRSCCGSPTMVGAFAVIFAGWTTGRGLVLCWKPFWQSWIRGWRPHS